VSISPPSGETKLNDFSEDMRLGKILLGLQTCGPLARALQQAARAKSRAPAKQVLCFFLF